MMNIHRMPCHLAGRIVKIKTNVFVHGGKEFEVRDWWDRCAGYGWMLGLSNPVCTSYAIRAGFSGKAEMFDNEVLYGRVGQSMHLFHISELEDRHTEPGNAGSRHTPSSGDDLNEGFCIIEPQGSRCFPTHRR